MIIDASGLVVVASGVLDEQEALLAVGMGANAIAMEFGPTPRQVSVAIAHDIVRRLPPGVITIGSFASEMPQRIVEVVNTLGLSAADLVGPIGLSTVHYVAERVRTVIRTLESASDLFSYLNDPTIDHFRLPSNENDAALANALPIVAEAGRESPLIVCALDEFSVARVVGGYPVWGVDAGSRFRQSDGRIDALRLSQFVHRAQGAYAASRVDRYGRAEESEF
ncbi:MAG: hypothetical protein HKL87_09565 [Acidimicrobiaceae bacterium]|nr:hypothetical protein [Acidimicrobiaceae bacterium]